LTKILEDYTNAPMKKIVNDSGWHSWHNLFVAKTNIKYISDHHYVNVPKGTILSASFGGYFKDITGNISIGNVSRVNGKLAHGDYNIRKDKENYEEVFCNIWPSTLNVVKKIENWARNEKAISKAARNQDIKGIKDAIEHKMIILIEIEKLIKIK
jgi:hypothetical protein